MMAEFSDIKIMRVITEEVTAPRNDGTPGSALYAVPFELSDSPPAEWANAFVANWNSPPRYTSMHRPGIARLIGNRVVLDGTTMEEVEKYHKNTLSLVLSETNKAYREWLARREQQRRREEESSESHRKSVEDAAKRIKFD